MPKINVYLPSDLATAVRAAGFPVSPVCQRALADAIRSAEQAQEVIAALRDPGLDPDRFAEVGGVAGHALTRRLMGILEATIAAARPDGRAGTGRLLTGLLDEGANLAVRILQALDVDLDELRAAIGLLEADRALAEESAGPASGGDPSLADLTMPARNALAAAIEVAVALGHNYVGSEHMLLGLLDDRDTIAARALVQNGVHSMDVRRGLLAALAGFTHGRQAPGATAPDRVDDLARRLDAIEGRLAALGA